MKKIHKNSETLFEQAQQSLVGGVNSPVRAFKSVGGSPLFIKSGKGAEITCEDNQTYIDYVLSYGPLILGHANPEITHVLAEQLQKGTTFGAPTKLETACAEKIKQAYPYVDKVRFVSSGTEAAMSAIRLARGATNRSIIVKFNGCYHGHADALLVSAGSGALTLGVPDSAGVLKTAAANTVVLNYNDSAGIKKLFAEKGSEIAAVLMEPVCGNMGVITPTEQFVTTIRSLCNDYDALLVFDEVMCGFRSQQTGTHEWIGVEPDIVILGKIIGGGLPCGAYAGKKELLAHIAPEGPVYQAGTLSGNPLAMAAGLATLNVLDDKQQYTQLADYTKELCQQLKAVAKQHNKTITINQIGAMFSVFFTASNVTDMAGVMTCDFEQFNQFFHHMLSEGVYLPPSQYEACFTSICHNEQHLAATINAFKNFCKN
ncbi:glutamate-1-semialdehyde-2,1-aminomutase [Candidatus Marinamargulisbacteria bacterium SCGC AG-414-C22]|nr:glutamate-1-semialdehyde-2,1-aminomutase [Candidatus Marinamargulisbacteria bacterium SCGC AG-414-C22]